MVFSLVFLGGLVLFFEKKSFSLVSSLVVGGCFSLFGRKKKSSPGKKENKMR